MSKSARSPSDQDTVESFSERLSCPF